MDDVFDILVSGHLCLDLIPDMHNVASNALEPGRLAETGELAISTGGTVSNTGLSLLRLGVKVGMMAAVGDDLIGQAIISTLHGHDERLSRLIRIQSGQASSYSVVLSPQNADRMFLHHTGTNASFSAGDIDYAMAKTAKVFHLGYPPLLPRLIANDGYELQEIYRQLKTGEVITSMDMATPDPDGPSGQANWLAILRNVLPYVDVFLPSIEEALFMLRRPDYDAWRGEWTSHLNQAYLMALADELLEMGTAIVGFKLGSLGFFLRTAELDRIRWLKRPWLHASDWSGMIIWHPAFQVEVAGTTGAGDAAYAGFLAAMVRGNDPLACVRMACAVGACNVESNDSISGVRDWEATQQRLSAGWPVRFERLPGYDD